MLKRSCLGIAIVWFPLTTLAVPFLTTDPVSLGMGGTGAAGGRLSSGPFYNPALLSFQSTASDDFIFSLQVGAIVSDEDESYDTIKDLTDDDIVKSFEDDLKVIESQADTVEGLATTLETSLTNLTTNPASAPVATINAFQTSVNNLNGSVTNVSQAVNSINSTGGEVINSFSTLDNNRIRGLVEVGVLTLFPDETLAIGLSINGRAFVTGRLTITDEDINLLNEYLNAMTAYSDQLSSTSSSATSFSNDLNCALTASCTPTEINDLNNAVPALTTEVDAIGNFNYGGSSTANTNDGDTIIFQNGELAPGADDPNLTSSVRAIGVGIGEVGLTLSKPVEIYGRNYHIGVTPKYQMISIFDYVYDLESSDDFDIDDVRDTEETYAAVNVDVGGITTFGLDNEFVLGLTIHDLIPREFESERNFKVRLSPSFRAGFAYLRSWYRFTADVDLNRNQPVGAESRTQYLAFGGEVDFWDLLHLRAGYRANIAKAGQNVVSVGFGLTPFFDFAALVNPANRQKEFGFSVRLGFGF